MKEFAPILHHICRLCGRASLAVGVALLVAACSSGVKGVDKPFPKLADAPPKPEPATTKEQRDALRADMTARRQQMQNTAQALLRGGTEAVSAVPAARPAPPPLPDNLPVPPDRPASAVDSGAGGERGSVAAPGAADLPEAVAADEAEAGGGAGTAAKEEEEEAAEEKDDGDGND